MAGIEIVSGAAVGLAFQELYKAIKDVKERSNNFKATLDSLENRIGLLRPTIGEMDRLNQVLGGGGGGDNPGEEIRMFIRQLEKATELVYMSSKLTRRHFLKKNEYAKRLAELDSSLEKLLAVEFQAALALDVKRLMAEVVEMNKKLDGSSSSIACFDMHFKLKNKNFHFHFGFGTQSK